MKTPKVAIYEFEIMKIEGNKLTLKPAGVKINGLPVPRLNSYDPRLYPSPKTSVMFRALGKEILEMRIWCG